MSKINIGIPIDLSAMIRSKLLVAGGSGSGKSYAGRKIAEQLYGKVQIIIIDPEDEYASLREKYDFVLIGGENGDIPISARYAETLAHKLLETGMNAIINLFEMKTKEQIEFIRVFMDAMTYAPKNLWHGCVVIFDEFRIFADDAGKAASTEAMREAATKWRKRGYSLVLMTHRLSMVDKTLVAQCHSRIIGLNTLDIDLERAGKELGFKKDRWPELKYLEPGEFYAYGPAISREVIKFNVSKVQTKHPQPGETIKTVPPTPNAIKKILTKLEDIPKDAENELKTKQDLQQKIKEQEIEIKTLKSGTISSDKLEEIKKQSQENSEKVLQSKLNAAKIEIDKQYKPFLDERDKEIKRLNGIISKALQAFGTEFTPAELSKVEINIPKNITVTAPAVTFNAPKITKAVQNVTKKTENITESVSNDTGGLKKGAIAVLRVIASYHPKVTTRKRAQTLTGLSKGGLRNYLGDLKGAGYITIQGEYLSLTDEGNNFIGYVEPIPSDPALLVNKFADSMKPGAGNMLKYLLSIYPNGISREDLASETSLTIGGLRNYLGDLKGNDLVTENNGLIYLSQEFFE